MKRKVIATLVAGALLPLAAQAGSVTFKAPLAGATVSGTLGGQTCEVTAGGAARVEFFLESVALNVANAAPWSCGLNTTQFANGTHLLKAVAYDKRGKSSATQINISSGNNQRGEAGAPACEPLRIWVSDGCNGVAGVKVTFSVLAGGGKVDGKTSTEVTTGSTGHAQTVLELGAAGGNNIVEANFADNPATPAVFQVFGIRRTPGE